jgi:hypothetical protein
LRKINPNTNNSKILTDLEPFDGRIFHSDLDQFSNINIKKQKKKKKKKKKRKRKNQQKSLEKSIKKTNIKLFSSVNENRPTFIDEKYSPWNNSNRNRLLGNLSD